VRLLSLFLPLILPAQVDTGTLAGTVGDSSGGILPGVKLSVVNEATGQRFDVELIPPGFR
jgi:hypothetical protein